MIFGHFKIQQFFYHSISKIVLLLPFEQRGRNLQPQKVKLSFMMLVDSLRPTLSYSNTDVVKLFDKAITIHNRPPWKKVQNIKSFRITFTKCTK